MADDSKKGRLLKMLACNATNSAAIDDDGNLWVWGSGRYGLCGGADPHGGNKH
jgi:alpha-tubulin suppressor-like RCC1 family protein